MKKTQLLFAFLCLEETEGFVNTCQYLSRFTNKLE